MKTRLEQRIHLLQVCLCSLERALLLHHDAYELVQLNRIPVTDERSVRVLRPLQPHGRDNKSDHLLLLLLSQGSLHRLQFSVDLRNGTRVFDLFAKALSFLRPCLQNREAKEMSDAI